MKPPQIRLAQNNEGEEIHRILASWGLVPEGLDWIRVYPNWLVAERNGKIVGVCQVLVGYPLGHIGFLAVDKAVHMMGNGWHLFKAAESMLANSGCDGFTSPSDYPPIMKSVAKFGFTVFGPPVNWLFKRVYRKQVTK